MFKLDPAKIREDFSLVNKGVYFDNACMSLKPRQVIDKMSEYYSEYTSCAGRSIHSWSRRLETEIAESREEVRKFIHAGASSEIIFLRNTTEGINLVAHSLGLRAGDEVIISDKEHNSNLLPWLRLRKQGIRVVIVPSNADNTFNLNSYADLFTEKTKLVSVVHTSNLDGVTNPVREIAKIAHKHGALCLVDGAQSVPSDEVDVLSFDVDFLAFSGHKMLGPAGTGVLFGKKNLLENMDQFLVGGETVIDSTYEGYLPEKPPMKFEAGLQDYAGIIGLGEACRYLRDVDLAKIRKHEIKLNSHITAALANEKRIRILGPPDAKLRSGIFSFIVDGMDVHHVAKMLDVSRKIMVRSGAHCVHSWFNKHALKGSVRASVYLYNTIDEADLFVEEVRKIAQL